MKNISISIYFVHAILKHAQQTDIDWQALLRRNKISLSLLKNKDAWVSAENFARLQQNIAFEMNDEMLGYLSQPLPLGTFSLTSHSLIHSKTLGQALQRHCQIHALINCEPKPHIDITANEVSITFKSITANQQFDTYTYESLLFYIHRFSSWLINKHIPILHVDFQYQRPGHASEYRALFSGAPVNFEEPLNRLVFDADWLNTPIAQTSKTLKLFLKQAILNMLISAYDSQQWTSKIYKKIGQNLKNSVELNDIADKLSLHPQTLRRRLQNEGTSFQKIKNQARRDLAIQYLSKSQLSVEEIASRTGFSEASAFIRAFKSWTGATPYTYRKN